MLWSIREATSVVRALIASWQLGYHTHHEERHVAAEECWLGVHSDASLKLLFGPEILTTQLSINAQSPLMKRVKQMFRLRRLLIEKLIAPQHPLQKERYRVQTAPLSRSLLVGSNSRRNRAHYSSAMSTKAVFLARYSNGYSPAEETETLQTNPNHDLSWSHRWDKKRPYRKQFFPMVISCRGLYAL